MLSKPTTPRFRNGWPNPVAKPQAKALFAGANLQLLIHLWIYATFVVCTCIGYILLLPLTAATIVWDPDRRIAGLFFRGTARLIARLSPLWRFTIANPPIAPLQRAHVVVSNHESHLDAFLISAVPWEMKWLAKQSLFRVPFLGWGMRLVGDIALRRGQRASADVAMQRCRAYLERGMSIFVFPEGTRAADAQLLPFKEGAFRLALQAQVPVLPMAVAGTRTGMRKNSARFRPSRALLKVGTPIDTDVFAKRFTDASGTLDLRGATAALTAHTREIITAMRAELLQQLGAQIDAQTP